MWLFFALLAGSFYTLSGLATRYVLKGSKDAWAFSFWFSAVGAIVSLPFALYQPVWQPSTFSWVLTLVMGALIMLHNWLSFRASNYLTASVSGTITKLRLVWVFLLGVVLTREPFSFFTLVGVLLTIMSSAVIFGTFRKLSVGKGLNLAVAATVVYACIVTINKSLFTSFSPDIVTFFIFFVPAVLNLLLMPNSVSRVSELLTSDRRGVMLACGTGALANLAMVRAFALGQVTAVVVIIEAFLLVTLVGEHFWLKERSQVLEKVSGVILAVLGAMLITLK
ncbi:MAG TPA: DMT family transporter [Vitreimonas sp.]|nr:DMT family transporter [Vitreimonas sp.]